MYLRRLAAFPTAAHQAAWLPAASNRADLPRLWPMPAFAAPMAALIIFRHCTNIRRLLPGAENRIGRSSPLQ